MIDDNLVQPFRLDRSHLRGRLVRLGSVLDDIITASGYPESVSMLLGESITLAVVLAGALKYDGVFNFQIKGDGPISLLVTDVTSEGNVRAYAQFDEDAVAKSSPDFRQMVGSGHVAFTVDQGASAQRTQGLIELSGQTMADCVQHYFRQSEPLETGIKLAVGQVNGKWRAAALMMQRMPGDEISHSGDEDDWRRAMILASSATDEEMLSEDLTANDLLYRLFHEEEPRIYAAQILRKGCRCSHEKVVRVLGQLTAEELTDMRQEDGGITVTCEFCNKDYKFDDQELSDLMSADN